jgi:hypothetical protein
MFSDSDSVNVGDDVIGEVPGITLRENAVNRGTVQLIHNLGTGGR